MGFKNDMIGRDKVLEDLIKAVKLVYDTGEGTTLCLDGDWGCGKTYVLNELEVQLEEITRQSIRQKWGPKYYVLHYNCWQHDYYEEPLAAIVSVFQKKLRDHLKTLEKTKADYSDKTYEKADVVLFSAFTLICAVLIELAKKQLPLPENYEKNLSAVKETGGEIKKVLDLFKKDPEKKNADDVEGIQDLFKKVTEEAYWDSLAPFSAVIQDARDALKMLTEEYTVVFVVDELDRCLPGYAIKVLERLHHLFDQQEKCAVILATDKKQLYHTIRECFGEDTEPEIYLKKFIHYTYHLRQKRNKNGVFAAKYASYFNLFIMDSGEKDYLRDYLIALFADTDMRTQELLFVQTEMLHRLLFGNTQKYPAKLLLVEITLTFFSHYERQYTNECKWTRLGEFPFLVNDEGTICLRYEHMDDFKMHLRKTWQPLQQDSGIWITEKDDPFYHAMVGCCSQLITGRLPKYDVHLSYQNRHLIPEMLTYAETLRKYW